MKDGDTSESLLQQAARHVAKGSQIVARQRERIVQLKLVGGSTIDAEQTLRIFLNTLEIFEQHQRELLQDQIRQRL